MITTCFDCGRRVYPGPPSCPKCGCTRAYQHPAPVVVHRSSAGSVFNGLFLFFIGLPAMLCLGGCIAAAMAL